MIEKAAVYHQSRSNFAYALDDQTLEIKLRTKKDNVKEVILIGGDPFDWGQGVQWTPNDIWRNKEYKMIKKYSTAIYDYWFITVQPQWKRFHYMFELRNESEVILYTEKGFYINNLEEVKKYTGKGFNYPYINKIDVFAPPAWVKETVWYQIFPERFANGNQSLNPENTLEWGKEPFDSKSFYGGDLEGIIKNIDHLVNLGVNGLYLTPIFTATSNHKYDTLDYLEIDPHFGDKEKLKQLIAICHQNGIKVMFDAVFNHVSYYHFAWQDVLKNQQESKYKDWFFINSWPVKDQKDFGDTLNYELGYETFAFTPFMPKLNTANPEVKDYLLRVGRYWVKEFDIDGWRLDVANEVDSVFWREFRKEVKSIKDVYILGEIWSESYSWLQGDQFDGVMNYHLTSAIIDYFGTKSIDLHQFHDRICDYLFWYPKNVQQAMFNLLGSHDTERILTTFEKNGTLNSLKLAYLFLLTSNGCCSIYYGDEIGMKGNQDPDCRKCMVWDQSKWNHDLFKYLKWLIELRKDHPVLTSGELTWLRLDEDFLAYKKSYQNQTAYVIINNSDHPRTINIDEIENQNCLITNQVITKDVKISAYSAHLAIKSSNLER